LLCTFPELDPFGPRGEVEYCGPIAESSSGRDVAWSARDHPRILAYLKPGDPRFGAIVDALGKVAAEALVAAPGLTDAQAARFSTARVRVFAEALNLDRLLDSADLCVAHGGTGFTARALLAGVALALLPTQLEQFLVARRLEAAGAAAAISPDDPPPDFVVWLSGIAARADLREGAQAFARSHRGYDFDAAAARVAQRIAAALPA
jgi:UDP:flavonoid glycosyltransferase YjiC (YdhE family)